MPREHQRPPTYGGVLRQARASTGQMGQDTRLAQGRSPHVSRGNFVNYYDDLKISTTPEGAGKIREEEAAFKKELAARQKEVNRQRSLVEAQYAAGQEQLAAAYGNLPDIPGYKEALADSWKKAKGSFVPIRVVSNGQIEGTYMLPKEAAESLAKEKGLTTSWANGGFNVDVRAQGRVRGAELHTALGEATNSVYNKFVTEATPKITSALKSAKGELSSAQGVLKGAESSLNEQYTAASSSLSAAEAALAATKAKRAMEWKNIRETYEKKKETIAQIFSNMKVEEAKETK